MVVLDNLVVSVALPSIHRDLGASIQSLEWTVNAYVLSYAVLLLTGAALGDRFGRKRMFMAGIALFTAVLGGRRAGPVDRPADRRPRHAGHRRRDRHAADADPAGRRLPARPARDGDRASGRGSAASPSRSARWSAAPSCRPPRGTGSSGSTCRSALVLVPLAGAASGREPRPQRASSTCRGWRWARPACSGSCSGWSASSRWAGPAPRCSSSLAAGVALVIAFIVHERRTEAPMLPMSFFARPRLRGHQRGLAGHVLRDVRLDLLPQPVPAERAGQLARCRPGVKLLVWTGATMIVSPLAGFFSERFGSRLFMAAGLGAAGDRAGLAGRAGQRRTRATPA